VSDFDKMSDIGGKANTCKYLPSYVLSLLLCTMLRHAGQSFVSTGMYDCQCYSPFSSSPQFWRQDAECSLHLLREKATRILLRTY